MWAAPIDSVYVYIDGKNHLEICMVNRILKFDLFVVIKMILFTCAIYIVIALIFKKLQFGFPTL